MGKGSKDNAASRHRKITVWTMRYPQAIINQIEYTQTAYESSPGKVGLRHNILATISTNYHISSI